MSGKPSSQIACSLGFFDYLRLEVDPEGQYMVSSADLTAAVPNSTLYGFTQSKTDRPLPKSRPQYVALPCSTSIAADS